MRRFEFSHSCLERLDERPAFSLMRAGRESDEVLWPVVIPDPVEVVDVFVAGQGTSEVALHHEAMLEDVAPVVAHKDVSVVPGESSSAPIRIGCSDETIVVAPRPARDSGAAQAVEDGLGRKAYGPTDSVRRLSGRIARHDHFCLDRILIGRRDAMVLRTHRHASLDEPMPNSATGQRDGGGDLLKASARDIESDQVIRVDETVRLVSHRPIVADVGR